MRHGVKSLRESWCARSARRGEREPPKAMAVAQLFAPEIERTPFRVARKMATLRRKAHRACPAGGSLQAILTKHASPSPSSTYERWCRHTVGEFAPPCGGYNPPTPLLLGRSGRFRVRLLRLPATAFGHDGDDRRLPVLASPPRSIAPHNVSSGLIPQGLTITLEESV